MSRTILTEEMAEQAVYGGAILGGGGGGWISLGLKMGKQAFSVGKIEMVTIDELHDTDTVACVSLVGAPAAPEQYVDDLQLYHSIRILEKNIPEKLKALMTNENGAATTVNGWLQSALTGLPIVDAPCNGRAHPTGSMGALNLSEEKSYISHQGVAGGKGSKALSGYISGTLDTASDIVRQMSVKAGGMVAVARNPVSARYIRKHAAIGAITQAISVGEIFLREKEGLHRIEAVVEMLKGRIIVVGTVNQFQLETKNGFDVGRLDIDGYELTFWNEYMTLEKNRERKGTFPDLIMTFDAKSGNPVVSAEIQKGQKLVIICVPKSELILGSTMHNERLLKSIEPVIHKQII